MRVWDLARGQDYRLLTATVKGFAAHPKAAEVAVATGKDVTFYEPSTGARLRSFTLAPEDVTALAYSPDGATLAVAWSVPPKQGKEISPACTKSFRSRRRTAFSYSTQRPASRGPSPTPRKPRCCDMGFSPDGTLLAATGWGKALTLIDAATGKPIATLDGADGGNTHLAFGPGGVLVRATTGHVAWSQMEPEKHFDGVIEVWDTTARKRLRTVNAGKGLCNAVALSPDGQLLAAAVEDSVALVRLDTGEQKTLPTAAHTLTFSPDGQRLVTGTPVGVKFWDPQSGREVLTLGNTSVGGGNTSRVAFANPAGLVLVSEADGLRVYDGRPWVPPPVVAKAAPREPKQEAPADERPEAVKSAVGQAVAALEQGPGGRGACMPSPRWRPTPTPPGSRRIACESRWPPAAPKLRPVVPAAAAEPSARSPRTRSPTGRARRTSATPPGLRWPSTVLRNADGTRVATFMLNLEQRDVEDAKKAGRSPWLAGLRHGHGQAGRAAHRLRAVPLWLRDHLQPGRQAHRRRVPHRPAAQGIV